MILWLEIKSARLADGLQDDEITFATSRSTGYHVGELHLQLIDFRLSSFLCSLSILHLGFEFVGTLQKCRAVLRRGLSDLLSKSLLLSAQIVGSLDCFATRFISTNQFVHKRGVFAASDLGGTNNVRVITEEFQIDHKEQSTVIGRNVGT